MFNFLPLIAFVMDLAFKDRENWPHPVTLIGKLIDWLENALRGQKLIELRTAGALAVIGVILLVAAAAAVLINLPFLGIVFAIYLAYAGLSLGSLLSSAREILNFAEQNDIAQARTHLGLLVSRQTSQLDQAGIHRTLAETVSENFNDGLVAPFFYLLLGGPVLLWIYKTASTFDSMWGYKKEEWKDLGWAAARIDDFLAYVPARISAFFLIISAALLRLNWKQAWKSTPKQARKMESPNAGWPMAASAWCLDAGMGGETIYWGEKKEKPVLGPVGKNWTKAKMQMLLRLILLSGFLWILTGQAIFYIVYKLLGF